MSPLYFPDPNFNSWRRVYRLAQRSSRQRSALRQSVSQSHSLGIRGAVHFYILTLIHIAFVFVLGQIGGSVFPALTGIIAGKVGVQVLQPMLVGLLCAAAASWLILPKDTALHQD